MMRRMTAAAAACAGGLAMTALSGTAALALPQDRPVTSGCPAGQVLSVEELVARSAAYEPVVGVDANEDGIVCGRPLPEAAGAQLCPDCGVPVVYLFRDNDLPAAG